jgi:hypothetical protein
MPSIIAVLPLNQPTRRDLFFPVKQFRFGPYCFCDVGRDTVEHLDFLKLLSVFPKLWNTGPTENVQTEIENIFDVSVGGIVISFIPFVII